MFDRLRCGDVPQADGCVVAGRDDGVLGAGVVQHAVHLLRVALEYTKFDV